MEFTASAMLPYDDVDVARSVLRARLREVVERRRVPQTALDGATMLMAGPTVRADAAGRTWFEWIATLRIRRAPSSLEPAGHTEVRPAAGGRPGPDDPAARPTVDDLGLLRRRTG